MHAGVATAFTVNVTTGMAPAIMVGVVLMMPATVLHVTITLAPTTLGMLRLWVRMVRIGRLVAAAGKPLQ